MKRVVQHISTPLTREQELDVLREDLATYRQIENWGVTLLLTAIALVAKELHDTAEPSFAELAAAKAIGASVSPPSDALMVSPLLIGVVGMAFLFGINSRGRNTWKRIEDRALLQPRGWLGWLFGIAPFAVAIFLSLLYLDISIKNFWWDMCLIAGCGVLLWQVKTWRGEKKLWEQHKAGSQVEPAQTQSAQPKE